MDEGRSRRSRGRRASASDEGEVPGEEGGLDEEKLAGRGACRRENLDTSEARSRVDWPEEVEERAQTVDELLKPCGGLVAVLGQGVGTTY